MLRYTFLKALRKNSFLEGIKMISQTIRIKSEVKREIEKQAIKESAENMKLIKPAEIIEKAVYEYIKKSRSLVSGTDN